MTQEYARAELRNQQTIREADMELKRMEKELQLVRVKRRGAGECDGSEETAEEGEV